MNAHTPVVLRARYLFPVDGKPLRDATIRLLGERIVAVDEKISPAGARDLGNVAILPGLVNAHTHLEFSDLEQPLGSPGESLPQWIRKVIACRRTRAAQPAAAIQAGLNESLRAGTTTISEIATSGWPTDVLPQADVTVFHELLGLLPAHVDERLADAESRLDTAPPTGRAGLSPHAPYSVHPELFRGLVSLARRRQIPMAMHLAESREELELLASGTGQFRDLLEELNVWSPDAVSRGTRVLDYLKEMTAAPRALAIHGNYLAPAEIDFLAAHANQLAVVYCPRTQAWFGHKPYPLAAMLAAGVSIALGTDSRASNPDLSLLEEMRFVARHHPQLDPRDVLELGTIAGARALGVDREIGSLAPGKLANLSVLPLQSGEVDDPYELLFDSTLPANQTWYHGREISRPE